MKPARFGYLRATSVADALAKLATHGPEAQLLAGGQTLLPSLAFRLSTPNVLVDISRIDGLKGVTRNGDTLRIGAITTHAVLGHAPLVASAAPLLTTAVPSIAHVAVRNRGTIGGSLAYADPAAELPACCVALAARIELSSATGTRLVAADQFFTGLFETALQPGEMITAILVPVATANARSAIYEIARRSGDYAMAGLAATASQDGAAMRQVRLAFFGVGVRPVLAHRAAAELDGHALSPERIAKAEAALAADLDPPADQHGSVDMKRQLARVVLRRTLMQLATPGQRNAA